MLLKHPAMALEQCRITIEDMAHLTQKGVGLALEMARDLSVDHLEEVRKLETAVDDYEDKLGAYLVKLTGRDMTPEQNELVSKYLHTISDLELISDQALVIAIGSREAFEKYMKAVYGACNTSSVYHETEVRALKDVQPGDILVYPSRRKGTYGHAIMIADVAKSKSGKLAILCIEGNTPAREAHIVRNPNTFRNPWFVLKGDEKVINISVFRFNKEELRHY